MKRIFLFAAILGAIAGFYYLYQWQLGAVAFFLLSIYFFYLAYHQYFNKEKRKHEKGR